MAYKTLLAGLGRIGATYDIDGKRNQKPRSHLGAMQADCSFDIACLVDQNKAAFDAVKKYWEFDPEIFTEDLPETSSYELCVFATPPQDRIRELQFSLEHGAKVIIFEKPLSSSYEDAKAMLDMWESSQTKPHILVNYTRRFDDRYVAMKSSFSVHPDRIVCCYSKGLENYASHHIDFIQHWFGNIRSVQAFGNLDAENPSFSCKIDENTQVDFLGISDRDYDVFDIHLWFQDKRIDIVNGGTEIRKYLPVNNLYYNGYSHLAEDKASFSNGLVHGMTGLYQEALKHLSGDVESSTCDSLHSAVNVMKVIKAVKRSIQTNGTKLNLEDI